MVFRLFGIQRLGSQHLILLQYTGNLFRPFAVNSQVKDALDYWGGILVNDPMVFIGWVSAIAIGRFPQMLAAGAFLTEYDPDFLLVSRGYHSLNRLRIAANPSPSPR